MAGADVYPEAAGREGGLHLPHPLPQGEASVDGREGGELPESGAEARQVLCQKAQALPTPGRAVSGLPPPALSTTTLALGQNRRWEAAPAASRAGAAPGPCSRGRQAESRTATRVRGCWGPAALPPCNCAPAPSPGASRSSSEGLSFPVWAPDHTHVQPQVERDKVGTLRG